MAVVIRMRRTGRRNRPCYRINVSDSRSPRDGSFLETIGLYDPVNPNEEVHVKLDVERAKHWLSVGALPSDTVRSIFKKEGVFEGVGHTKGRKRTGRSKSTATASTRLATQKIRAERKEARQAERLAAKKAAAAAGAEGEGGEE